MVCPCCRDAGRHPWNFRGLPRPLHALSASGPPGGLRSRLAGASGSRPPSPRRRASSGGWCASGAPRSWSPRCRSWARLWRYARAGGRRWSARSGTGSAGGRRAAGCAPAQVQPGHPEPGRPGLRQPQADRDRHQPLAAVGRGRADIRCDGQRAQRGRPVTAPARADGRPGARGGTEPPGTGLGPCPRQQVLPAAPRRRVCARSRSWKPASPDPSRVAGRSRRGHPAPRSPGPLRPHSPKRRPRLRGAHGPAPGAVRRRLVPPLLRCRRAATAGYPLPALP